MEVIKLKDHTVGPMDSYLFDTNVWLFIYGPMAGSHQDKQQKYAALLQEIINRKATLYVTSLVISEYVNVVLRMGFNQWKDAKNLPKAKFKQDYRLTTDYKTQLAVACAEVNEILKVSERRPDDFNALNIDKIISDMSQDMDFNDSYMVKNCEKNNLMFVSDDSDIALSTADIKVIKV